MAYSKIKTESYQLLGGMNDKASPYNNTPNEFRELTNYQFSEPGALDKRYGSTLYAQGSSTKILGLYEYNRLNGASYLLFNDSSGLYKTSLTGTTLIGGYTLQISTANINQVGGAPGKADFLSFSDWALLSVRPESQSSTQYISSYSLRKTQGTTLYLFGLPPYNQGFSVTEGIGITTLSIGTPAGGSLSAGVAAVFYLTFAWQNNRGYIGPASVFTPVAPYEGFYRAIDVNGVANNSIAISNS